MTAIKKSLQTIYSDDPVILDMLEQIDYSGVQKRYETELYSRISYEDVKLVEAMLTGDLIQRYNRAMEETALAMTRPIRDLMMFATENSKEGKLN